jgi:hypothetical protein
MIQQETREVGQIVWLNSSNRRDSLTPLTITRVLAKYVECSNGKTYNLAPGDITANERGCKSDAWDYIPWITTKDKSEEYQEQRVELKRKRTINDIVSEVPNLADDQLARILSIVQESPPHTV